MAPTRVAYRAGAMGFMCELRLIGVLRSQCREDTKLTPPAAGHPPGGLPGPQRSALSTRASSFPPARARRRRRSPGSPGAPAAPISSCDLRAVGYRPGLLPPPTLSVPPCRGSDVLKCTVPLTRTSAPAPMLAPLKMVAPVARKALSPTRHPTRCARGPTTTLSPTTAGCFPVPRTTAFSITTQFAPIPLSPLVHLRR
jgi:hypothetical protein